MSLPESDGNWSNQPGPLRKRSGPPSPSTRGEPDWWEAGCIGRNPWIRLPLFLWCAWMWKGHLADPLASDMIKGLNLGIHELGHMLWSPFGEFLAVAGGTLTQCLAPVIGGIMFVRQRDPFALFFAVAWLGTNLFDVATYCADARAMELPLVSPFAGDEIGHDWNYLLSRTGLLQSDLRLAGTLRWGASLCFLVALAGMGWCLWKMWSSPGPRKLPVE